MSMSLSFRRVWVRSASWLLLVCAAPLMARPGSGAIEWRVLADTAKVGRDDGVWVTLEAHNRSDQPAQVLRWKLPLGASDTPDFVVERDGKTVAYLGRRVKRAPPTPADYLAFAPGETKRFRVDLARRYDFARSADYAIGFRYQEAPVSAERARAVVLRVEGRPAASPPSPSRAKVVTGTTQFVGCSVQRQGELTAARSAASDYALDVNAYLAQLRNGARYTTWMGAHDNARYALVSSHFAAIGSYIDSYSPLTFDCTCTDDYYAYVYPLDSARIIYLCNAFWTAPLTGTDSRAGTLIHEASHFNAHGGTDDHAYGQAAAMQLAINTPALAVMNADSHEYLAENTPVREGNTPSPPRNLAAQGGNAQAVLTFDAPSSTGGSAITNYQYTSNNGANWTTLAPADAASPVTITGLTNGENYNFRLRAMNANGNGGASTAVGVTPTLVVDAGSLVLGFTRSVPGTALLYDGLAGPNPSATWILSLRNDGAVPITGISLNASVSGALSGLLWQCTAAGIVCTPGNGATTLALGVGLGAGDNLTVELSAQVDPARAYAQLDARATLGGNGSLSRQLIEPANVAALFRGTFE